MKALYFLEKDKIILEDVQIPKINDDEILMKVHAAPICGTDLKILNNGHFKIKEGTKRILGHEVAGVVAEVGKNIIRYKKGNRISIAPNMGCGVCRECISGNTQLCKDYEAIGITFDGAFAEYMKIPKEFIDQGNVFIFPDSISFEEASLSEVLAVVISGAEACKISYADIVLIVGAGPIGIVHTMLARISGAQKVIVSEVLEHRRKQALKFGADIALNPSDPNFKKILLNETKSRGPDVVIIASPSAKAQEDSIEITARGGRINFFGGLPKGEDSISLKSNIIHYKSITINGTTGSNLLQYWKALELIISKKIPISKIISERFKLEDYGEAFKYASSGECLKVIFTPGI
jgi:L-iditol 2-dehydrogenase